MIWTINTSLHTHPHTSKDIHTHIRTHTRTCTHVHTHTHSHARTSSALPPTFSASKDRLLTSEIKELQTKIQHLEKENHELRQELAKTSGIHLSKLRAGRKVSRAYYVMVCDNFSTLESFKKQTIKVVQ